MPKMAPQRTAGACRTVKFFYIGLRVPPRCTASLWVTSLGTRIQCGGTLSLLPSGTDSLVVCSDTVYAALYGNTAVGALLQFQCDASPRLFRTVFGEDSAQHLYDKFAKSCDENLLKLWAGLDSSNRARFLRHLCVQSRV